MQRVQNWELDGESNFDGKGISILRGFFSARDAGLLIKNSVTSPPR